MRSIALALLVVLTAGSAEPATAAGCNPRTFSELLKCQDAERLAKTLAVFRTAGESSAYWPCLRTEFTAASDRALQTKNVIDTPEELDQVLVDAIVTCKPQFPKFESDLRKEADDAFIFGAGDTTSDEIQYQVYLLWYAALTAPK